MTAWRLVLGTVGVVAGCFGLYALVSRLPVAQFWPILRWGVLGIVVHDALLAPLEVVLGWLLLRSVAARFRSAGRAALLGVVCLMLVTAVIVGGRMQRQNPTVLAVSPLVAVAVGVLALGLAVVVLVLQGRRAHQPV